MTRAAKQKGLIKEIRDVHISGRPVLVGTGSVEESEHLALALKEAGITCQVLNAKNDEKEAKIIAQAGAVGAVTVSTNMAGRGTDIRLGGVEETDKRKVSSLGGLYVIGISRHESLRIDNQLRGRAGRQGDPGALRFFISLEDDFISRSGIKKLLTRFIKQNIREHRLTNKVIRKEIARAQRIIDGQNFEIRKTLWNYSSPIEKQRQVFHNKRKEILLLDSSFCYLKGNAPWGIEMGMGRNIGFAAGAALALGPLYLFLGIYNRWIRRH
jgi:preprotein translocase subunit SecA